MALSKELINRLDSDEEPLKKRLKLAHNVFFAIDLPITRKEDLILQWLCKVCTKKEDVWNSLKWCLKSENLNIKANIKKSLIDVLVQKLNGSSPNKCNEVLECCNLLFSNTGMQQYLSKMPEDLQSLLKSLIHYVHMFFKNTLKNKDHFIEIDINTAKNIDESTIMVYNTILSVIENLMQIYKQSINTRDEISIIFIHEVLYTLCSLIDHKCTDNTSRLESTAHKCIQLLIFMKNKHAQDKINETVLSELFLILASNIKTMNLQNNLETYICVFRAVVGCYKSDTNTLDIIFRKLIISAGKYKKEILISFFYYFGDTSFDFENKVDNITLLQFFQKIVDDILSVEKLSPVDYKLLTRITYFYPTLIEKKIDNIIYKLYLQEPTIEHNDLLISILDASILLRQEHKLISQLLTNLQEAITTETKSDLIIQSFFSLEFKKKFTKVISCFTNSQVLIILKILTDNLNRSCMESLKCNTTSHKIIILKTVAELLIAFFNGVCIFGNTSTLTHQQEFLSVLNELGKNLSVLIKKALHVNHNTNVITVLLSVILSWSEIRNMTKYYLPKVKNHELIFPISDDHWQQLIQKITNFGEEECRNNMNKVIIHRIKYYALIDSPIKFDTLIDGLKYFWSTILRYNSEIILLLNDKEISELVSLLVTDMMLNESKFNHWMEIITKENLQENRRFLIYLLYHVLAQIRTIPMKGVIKSVIQHIDIKLILSAEFVGKKKIKKILELIKKEILECKWEQMENTAFNKVKLCLDIIVHMPLTFFKSDIKVLLLLVIYTINKECVENGDITTLCNKIFLKLFQTTGLDILQYIDPVSVICQLSQSKAFSKALEQSLRNIKSYETLKTLINSSSTHKESMYIFLQCIENVRQKLDVDQKSIFKKAEQKLCKKIFNILPINIELPCDVKYLTLILKITALNKETEKTFRERAELTLQKIFVPTQELHSNQLLEAGLQLAAILFRNYKEFEISPQIRTQIWSVMLKFPCENLLLPLIESTEAKLFQNLLNLIHYQMMEELPKLNSNLLENIFIVWNAILKSDMSAKRNKFRTVAIENLFKNIQVVNISEQYWSRLLELFQNILSSKHLYISNNIIDMSINVALKALEKETLSICNDVLILYGILLKVRMNIIVDKLPVLLLLYRRIIDIIIQSSKIVNDKVGEHKCRCLLLDFEKLTICLVKQKKDMMRLSPYVIADLIQLLSEGGLMPFAKISLENIIATLISICDQHGIALLSRTLPIYLQEMFKTQLDTFNKFHKFCGKI
ncbi:uncharacterized protein LOC124421519 [Vespa crabro]|uniref:uncharacterized protein LOC124421519 n=1 Tax=Vespa crabro TaxID=7445 RepID=UPI001F0327E3|nr:uncharacterized protein LOC124421519 [Vespa crabro]